MKMMIKMMMKRILSLLVVLSAFAVVAVDQPVVVYRGRIVPTAHPDGQAFSGPCEKVIIFRVYPEDASGEPVFESRHTVTVSSDGSFECLLSGERLTAAIRNGTARYIGVSIGAAAEIAPRRRVMPLPRVAHAVSADSIGSSSGVSELTVGTLRTDLLKVRDLEVQGKLSVTNTKDAVTLQRYAPAANGELRLGRQGQTYVFAKDWVVLARGIWKKTDVMATAPSSGVAFLHQLQPSYGGNCVLAVPYFCEKGDPIYCPCTVTNELTVSFRPFLSE